MTISVTINLPTVHCRESQLHVFAQQRESTACRSTLLVSRQTHPKGFIEFV